MQAPGPEILVVGGFSKRGGTKGEAVRPTGAESRDWEVENLIVTLFACGREATGAPDGSVRMTPSNNTARTRGPQLR